MPIWRRKRVQLTQPPTHLLDHPDPDSTTVYYLDKTGEIFDDYETYAARLDFYRTKHFQCEVTGKGGLDYFEAIQSELHEGKMLHARFPEALKAAVLRSVQWQIMGRLDNLVEAVYERFKDRYFPEEKVMLDIQGEKFWARILQVFPPKNREDPDAEPHRIGSNLSLPLKDAIDQDDPGSYFYKVQIQEENTQMNDNANVNGHEPATGADEETPNGNTASSTSGAAEKWGGSVMDVQCAAMSRDRLAFSKSILRRFLRDSVDREAAVASPWTVKPAVAVKYGIESEMPDDKKKDVESVRKGEMQKRKKIVEEKEGPPSKKQKKGDAKKEEAEREKAEQAAKEAAAKKKPIKYPTEDLDVIPTEREKKAGLKVRPVPKRDVPFGDSFEAFLMSWSYLQVFGIPLNLSPFTLDAYEQAIAHEGDEAPFLLAEIHTSLAYNIRQVPNQRNIALSSLYEHQQELYRTRADEADSISDLIDALHEKGNNWERAPLRATNTRDGWEDSMIGLIKDHATVRNFPRLRQVLTALLIPEDQLDVDGNPLSTVELYSRMQPQDKIAILSFLCDVSILSKSIRQYMEGCEEALTALRKEKTELNRERKRCQEQMDILSGNKEPEENKEAVAEVNGNGANAGSDDEGEKKSSSDGQSDGRGSADPQSSKGGWTVLPAVRTHAAQRKIEREKIARDKAAQAEYRKLDEELSKHDRRMEGIEAEFRNLLGVARARPIGKDRFYNKVWWLDGLGGSSLVTSGGVIAYGSGRIFIQGPSELDWEVLERREAADHDVMVRMREDLGEEGVMGVSEWGYFSDPDEFEELLNWFNHKGRRELQLKNLLASWKPYIVGGMKKRIQDQAAEANPTPKANEGRRTSRQEKDAAVVETYLTWTNKRSPTNPANANA